METALYIYTKQVIDDSVSLVANKFKDRVLADGGTFEANTCLINQINSLGGVFGVALNTISDFANRVQTDGGTFEAENCLLNIINDLGGVTPTPTEIDVVRRIELFNDEKISITSSIQNVNDISKVFTDYSQSFTIPASDTNNEIFRHWYENALDNGFNQNFRYNGYIEIDTQVFRTGKWQLESATVKDNRIEDYKITFYGNLVSLSDKFGEDKLKDIAELNDYTINYNGANVQTKVTTTSDTDLAFPLISSQRVWQYGGGGVNDISQNSHHIHYNELFPALKIARIFDAIENKYGVSFNGNFLTQSRFTKAYMWLKNRDTFIPFSTKVLMQYTPDTVDQNYVTLNADSFTINPAVIDELNSNSLTGVYFIATNLYEITFSTATNYIVSVFNNDAFVFNVTGTGISAQVYLPNTQGVYKVYLSTTLAVTFNNGIFSNIYEYDENNNTVTTISTIGLGSGVTSGDLDLPTFMPDIKVADFFSSILKMFNLTAFSFDEENYTLEQLENWYYQGEIKDFSENCVTDFEYDRIKPYKKVNFQYQKSESFLNRNYYDNNSKEYGNLDYQFNNDGADYTIQLPFENLMFNKFTGTNLQVGYSLNKEFNKYIPKPIILYQYENAACDFYFNNGTTTNNITNYNVFGQDVKYQNNQHTLNWGIEYSTYNLQTINNTLFKDYYFDYLNNLYSMKSRMVKVSMRLPYSELLALRLNDRIVIRDKRYIINSFTTDLDTFESKFELIQDFRTINFNNSLIFEIDNIARPFRINTVGREALSWSILNDPTGQIIDIINGEDYVELDLKSNTSGAEKIYSVESNLGDIIVIRQAR
jgi:hypothetical protein